MSSCPCGRELELADCCGPAIEGRRPAATAEALMRSRYTAHAQNAQSYLRKTHHPPDGAVEGASGAAAKTTTWTRLEIVDREAGNETDDTGVVEFRAHFRTKAGENGVHHERSRFRKIEGHWAYVDGDLVAPPPVKTATKPGRNTPCPCGSGKKFKRCCSA